MSHFDEKGFSLLELLIVCSIVALLAGMAVPKVSQVMASSRSARIAADLSTLDAAIVMYQTDNGQNPSTVADLSGYISDADTIKPPKGTCLLRDNSTITIDDDAYTINFVSGADGTATNEVRAQCEGKTSREFSR